RENTKTKKLVRRERGMKKYVRPRPRTKIVRCRLQLEPEGEHERVRGRRKRLAKRPARVEHIASPRRAPVTAGAGAAVAFLRAEEGAVPAVARNHPMAAAAAARLVAPTFYFAEPFGDGLHVGSP